MPVGRRLDADLDDTAPTKTMRRAISAARLAKPGTFSLERGPAERRYLLRPKGIGPSCAGCGGSCPGTLSRAESALRVAPHPKRESPAQAGCAIGPVDRCD